MHSYIFVNICGVMYTHLNGLIIEMWESFVAKKEFSNFIYFIKRKATCRSKEEEEKKVIPSQFSHKIN